MLSSVSFRRFSTSVARFCSGANADSTSSWSTTSSPRSEETTTETAPRTYKREFGDMYPDMLPSPLVDRRNVLVEKLVRREQLRRRVHIDIPEFYIGSLVAVTYADEYAPSRTIRFMGIVIQRMHNGLKHQILLRNCFNGLGVEVPIDIYNPLVRKIDVIKLQRHADPHLTYLRDALPEYSTFDMDMPAVPHPPGADIPECTLIVKLKPPPWHMRLHAHEFKGIDPESLWSQTTAWYKKKLFRNPVDPLRKYDIIGNYREVVNRDDAEEAHEDMKEFEIQQSDRHNLGAHLRKNRRRHLFAPVKQAGGQANGNEKKEKRSDVETV